jgi:hypothetical protein
MTVDEFIKVEIEKDREYWFDRVNFHLEKLIKRANRNKNLQRHMAMHYYTRNEVFQIKIKQVNKKLKKTLMRQKEKEKLDLLAEASLMA